MGSHRTAAHVGSGSANSEHCILSAERRGENDCRFPARKADWFTSNVHFFQIEIRRRRTVDILHFGRLHCVRPPILTCKKRGDSRVKLYCCIPETIYIINMLVLV
jgi:hypothetical protein